MKGKRLSGMIAAPLSPVTQSGQYDYGLLKSYVDYLVGVGCDAFFAVGSTGTFPILNTNERKLFAEGFVKAVDGRLPLCMQIGTNNEEETIDLARHAADVGADCLAAVPPYYYRFSGDTVVAYFKRIAAAIPALPFYVYNIPMYTNCDVTPMLLKQMKEEIPNLAGIKDTTQDFPRFVDYCDVMGNDFDNIMGSDAMCLAALQTGGKGGICAMASHNPELMVDMFAAYRAGDMKRAVHLQFLAARLRQLFMQLPFMSPRVEILRLRGLLDLGFKRPFMSLSKQQIAVLRDTLHALSDEFAYKLL